MHFDEEEHFLGGEVIEDRLRELRQQAGLTGRQVAESLSWPASKVSKLENGRQTPTDDDIRGWASVTHAEAETESLLASLRTLEVQHAEWQRQIMTGLRPHQDEIAELDAKTHLFRAELNLAQSQEIELYSGIFDQTAAVASYGRAARAIVTRTGGQPGPGQAGQPL
jgi:transcriptional regulator with XRE-family HTH domain